MLSMDSKFDAEEKLYRAVYPASMFWKGNGKVSSAAFLSRRGGCSVDRGDYREDEAVVRDMRRRDFKGSIIAVTVQDCLDVQAVPVYAPSRANIYHSEIHRDNEHEQLTAGQRKHLAASAEIVSREGVTPE